jgi:hypothetical protein
MTKSRVECCGIPLKPKNGLEWGTQHSLPVRQVNELYHVKSFILINLWTYSALFFGKFSFLFSGHDLEGELQLVFQLECTPGNGNQFDVVVRLVQGEVAGGPYHRPE